MQTLESGRLPALFQKTRQYLNYFFDHISLSAFDVILQTILSSSGTIYCSGVGKSGLIAQKMASTFTSTGTKAFFLSPLHALHGDLGAIEPGDIWIAFSKSGAAEELITLIPYIKKKGGKIIAVVSHAKSKLAQQSDLFIELPLEKELCPYNLAPTTSTMIQLIFADCLAIALMENKKIQMEQFAINHPAGLLGKQLSLKVADLMLPFQDLPLCSEQDILIDVLPLLSEKKCGCLLIINSHHQLLGIFTDGDFRRTIQKQQEQGLKSALNVLMTPNPKTISPYLLVSQALEKMEKDPLKPISVLPVVEAGKVIGLLRLHDIVRMGLIPKNHN